MTMMLDDFIKEQKEKGYTIDCSVDEVYRRATIGVSLDKYRRGRVGFLGRVGYKVERTVDFNVFTDEDSIIHVIEELIFKLEEKAKDEG